METARLDVATIRSPSTLNAAPTAARSSPPSLATSRPEAASQTRISPSAPGELTAAASRFPSGEKQTIATDASASGSISRRSTVATSQTSRSPPAAAISRSLPVGLNATANGAPARGSVSSGRVSDRDQIRIVPSLPPLARHSPSAAKANASTSPAWPTNCFFSSPDAASQRQIRPPRSAVAIWWPSSLQAAAVTTAAWLTSACSSLPSATDQISVSRSEALVSSRRPSALKASTRSLLDSEPGIRSVVNRSPEPMSNTQTCDAVPATGSTVASRSPEGLKRNASITPPASRTAKKAPVMPSQISSRPFSVSTATEPPPGENATRLSRPGRFPSRAISSPSGPRSITTWPSSFITSRRPSGARSRTSPAWTADATGRDRTACGTARSSKLAGPVISYET